MEPEELGNYWAPGMQHQLYYCLPHRILTAVALGHDEELLGEGGKTDNLHQGL